jgi:hypothetical protein
MKCEFSKAILTLACSIFLLIALAIPHAYSGSALFDGVKRVILYIEKPQWDYQEAARCHGIEERCGLPPEKWSSLS